MEEIIKTAILGLFFGTFGTTIGGIIGINIKNPSNRILSFILSFASGLMTAIICFDLIPEALKLSNIYSTVSGILLGILFMIICDLIVNSKYKNIKRNNNSLLKSGIIIGIGLALHNFPEGLAIGSGLEALFGAIAGNISQDVISVCLALAAGAMIYIVSGELIPESNKLYSGRIGAIGNIIGLIIRINCNVYRIKYLY